ncbi:hypothetical protein GE09DRAFT_1257085 [Coniochaeta sp. 2T2.1]|nr:hypothetical protein GE09DRAFT_1257085 [Coniochaeta sp. 2T2.1]
MSSPARMRSARSARHLAHYWSSKEFRVCATRARDSGYRIVYTLLATCQEARVTIAAHYARLQRIEGLDISNAASTADEEEHRDGDDETGCARCKPRRDPFSIFQSFDWIPANDLVVLCFPPKQAELPATQAITLARRCGRAARHIGLLLPKEVLLIEQFGLDSNGGRPTSRDGREGAVDDASQVSLIPEFLEALREPSFENCADAGSATAGRGGVKKAYIIVEGWYAPDPYWRFEAARPDETICPWEYYMSDEEMQQRRPGSNRTGTGHRRRQLRQVWWLGSGRGAMTLPDVGDIVERSPSSRIEGLATMVKAGCMDRGWPEFEGGDTLGLVKVNADEHGQPCVDVSGSGPVGGGR